MKKTADYHFEFQGSTMYLRVWEGDNEAAGSNEAAPEKPVIVVEPGRGIPLEYNRVDLAKEIARAAGTTAENLQWYEQSRDGTLKEYQFKPYEVEHRPYAQEMSRDDYEAAEKQGQLKPEILSGHHAVYTDISADKKKMVEAQVGERVESYEQRQNQEFARMNHHGSRQQDFEH